MQPRLVNLRPITLLLYALFAAGCAAAPRPAAIAAPPDTAIIKHHDGRAVITHNGRPAPIPAYCDYRLDTPELWRERIDDFVKSGATVFMLNVAHIPGDYFGSPYWPDDDSYPQTEPDSPLSIDNQAKIILALRPNATFYIRTWISPAQAWVNKHPQEIQTDEDGKAYRQASMSSPLFVDGITKGLRNLVAYCESRPWGDRVIGYLPCAYGEGTMPLNLAGKMFDVSPASQRGFNAWVRKRYANEAELRSAWHDPAITFDAVKVPLDKAWHAKRLGATPTLEGKPFGAAGMSSNSGVAPAGLFHFIEPSAAAPEQDYCRFQRDNFIHLYSTIAAGIKAECAARKVERLVAFDICKQPLLGWQILSAFDGAGDNATYPNLLQLSGSFDVGELLDDKNIDALFTPADYHARTVGFAFEPEGPADSLVVRGKTLILENDSRTYVGVSSKDQGAFRDQIETEAGLLRNEALVISRNFQGYWANIGSNFFHDVGVQQTIGRLVKVLDAAGSKPHHETADAIAFVIDDTAPMYEDFSSGFGSLVVIWQRIQGLAHCGVPYRLYMLSDLKRDDFPAYKVFFFPNLLCVNDDVFTLLHKKVLRNGNVAIFGPGTGITDGKILSAEPASKLLGVKMELVPRTTERRVIVQQPRGQHNALADELPAGMVYGDTLAYGPTLVPGDREVEAAGGQSLGMANTCFYINRTGLFMRESGRGAAGNGKTDPRGESDYAVLWSCAAPLPPALLRAAARYAGCNVWSEENDVVYASDSFVGVHTVKAGTKTIHLPRSMNVTDAVTGKRVASGVRQFKIEMDAVETRLFWLE